MVGHTNSFGKKLNDNRSLESDVCECMLSHFSSVRFFAIPWTVARQAPTSLGFSRKGILE